MADPRPSAYDLWRPAGGGTARFDSEVYAALAAEHGLTRPLRPGERREPLPCGWPTRRVADRPADDNPALTEETPMNDTPAPAAPDTPPAAPMTYDRLTFDLEAAGRRLQAHLDAGGTADGLADEVLTAAGPLAGEVLDALVYEHLTNLVTVACLLDESDPRSYQTAHVAATVFAAEIRRQGRETVAVRELVIDEIGKEASLAYALAKINDRRAAPGPDRRAHAHVEAFCLMTYTSADGTESETVWNSRDGVTPFTIPLRSGTAATHADWHSDVYAPGHEPKPGERMFVDLTRERAVEHARRALDRWAASEGVDTASTPSVEQLADSYLQQPGAPDLIEVPDVR